VCRKYGHIVDRY
jgi:hypothetical protein